MAHTKMNPLVKNLLLLLMVLGPAYWLIMTEDGQYRTDSVMLQLFGDEAMELNLKALDSRFTETELKKIFPGAPWQCEARPGSLGNHLCVAHIGVFNSVPAHYVTVFFVDEQVNAVKVVYRRRYHEQMMNQTYVQLGEPQADQESGVPALSATYRWTTGHGMVLLQQQLDDEEEAALLWISNRQLQREQRTS